MRIKKTGKLITDAVIMTAVSIIMQTVSVSFNLYLTNKIGTEGIGLFQLVMTVYSLCVTFSCAGIRLASTRIAAEISARGNSSRAAVRQCTLYALFMGCTVAALLFFAADAVAVNQLENASTALPLRILAASLPFVAMSCAFSGYFTATGCAAQYSGIRLAEQAIKTVAVVAALGFLLPRGDAYACAAVVIGITVSEAISFILSRLYYAYEARREKGKGVESPRLYSLLRIAVPDVLGASARSILLTIEHLMIPKGFQKSGSSQAQSLSIYGIIHAMVLPVLLYPSALLSSVSALLIPEMARKNALGDKGSINKTAQTLLHLTALFAIGSAAIMFFFSSGISALVGKPEAEHYIKVLAPLVPVMYCDMTVDAILRGLDQQLHSMLFNILDSGLCVLLVYFLLPHYAVKGYIFILFLSEIINFYLSAARLIKVCTVEFHALASVVKPLLCAVAGCAAFIPSYRQLSGSKIMTAAAIAAAAAVYIALLCLTRCLDTRRLRNIIKSSL